MWLKTLDLHFQTIYSSNFKSAVGQPFGVTIPCTYSESSKAKALPYYVQKQIKAACVAPPGLKRCVSH